MGLISRGTWRRVLLPLLAVCPLLAAPKLRLVETAVGPVSVAQGANAPARTVEAYNAGDGALNLSVTSSAAWLSGSVGAPRNCSNRDGACIPVQISMQTAALERGMHTATLTVSDPNAADAPQTITVTAAVGGAVPDRLDLFVAPNGSTAEASFTSHSLLRTTASTQSGGGWLSVALDGAGSFRFVLPYIVRATHQSGMAEGTYNGSIAVAGSQLAADNKTVPVTLRVTSQPIAQLNPERLQLRYAQGAARQRVNIAVGNRGLGTLSISGAAATTASGGDWLSAEAFPQFGVVQAAVNPGSLAPGAYRGTVTIATNAANAPLSVPVQLDVVAQGPPRAYAGQVMNNGVFTAGDTVAQGAIVAVFGEQFLFKDPAPGPVPLQTAVEGVRVLVNDRPAPIYYVSYNQINFQIPFETPPGEALVRVERDGQRGNAVSVPVASAAPRLLRLNIGDYGIAVNQDGSFPIPRTPGINSRPARPGEVLVFYAIGLGPTSPAVGTGAGAPSSPLARVAPSPTVSFSSLFAGATVEPLFAGLTPGFVGLYQINVQVPEDSPTGDRVRIQLQQAEASSNVVLIAVE